MIVPAAHGERAPRFKALHAKGSFLVLANVWDAASAKLVEACGGKAVATSSASLSWCHGFSDGEYLPMPLLLAALREIVAVTDLPVTVDFEGGFSDDPKEVVKNVGALRDAGAVGINLEDGTRDVELHAAKIAAIKDAYGSDIFVNVRTDVYLRSLVPAEKAVGESIARGERYEKAGADGIFVPFIARIDDIRKVVESTDLPVNVLVSTATPPISDMKAAGVRRVSTGAGPGRAAYGAAQRAMAALLQNADTAVLFKEMEGLADMNALLKRG